MQSVEMRRQDLFRHIETKPLALVILAGMAKEAREFAIVRREHDVPASSPDHLRETENIVFKTRERIGIEDECAGWRAGFSVSAERGPHQGPGFFSHAQPWSHDERVHSGIREEAGEAVRIVAHAGHDRGERRGMDAKRRARSCDRHQPRACTKRAARGKTRGTRLREPAGEDHGMTARIFISFDAWNGECLPPQSRTIGEGFGRDRRQDMFRDSDIRDDSAAAMDAARQQQVPRLAAKKCDGACGDYSGATDSPAGAVDAGGNIHGEDWPFRSPRPFIDTQDQSLGLPIEIAAKARAEERVDRESGRIEIKFLDGEDLAGPILGGKRGVALQAVARAKQSELDGKFLAREQAGGDKAVAAIVARPAKNRDAAVARNKPRGLACHCRAGLFHQHGTGRAPGDGQPVGLSHFGVGQEFWTRGVGQHAQKPG